jgi:hypothetical protein
MRPPAEPWLLFFRNTPADLTVRPPLASSLQSFESCLFLNALFRYPHALTACASAIESALKVGRSRSEQRKPFQDLLAQARTEFPRLATLPQAQLDDFRTLRNRIVHFGFHEGDDAVAASAMLLTGLPFLISVHEVVFGFDLCDALVPPFGAQLSLAIEVFRQQQPTNAGSAETLSVLGHLIRWSFRDSMMAAWEVHALDSSQSYDLQLDTVMKLREVAERKLEPSWLLDCPVCDGPDTLVCKLDEDLLGEKRIELAACFCAECGLRLSGAARPILNAVCAKAIDGAREKILSDYGIE